MTTLLTWRRPRDRVIAIHLAAAGLIGLQLLVRGWLGHDGYFSLDDFVFYTRAQESELWDADFLLTPYNGHLMPGAMAWVWLSTRYAPLDYGAVFTTMLGLQFVSSILVFLLLRQLFGSRPGILPALAVYCFSTITLPASWWWAAGLNQLPSAMAWALVLIVHLQYVRTGRWPWAVAGPLALAAGLLFFEKTALVVVFLGLLTWWFFSEGGWWRSLVTALQRYWLTWVGYLVVLVPYSIYYLQAVPDQRRVETETENVIELFDAVVRQALVPGLLGGPWRWDETGVVDSNAAPHPLMQAVAFALVGTVVVGSVLRHRRAARAWALAGVYVLILSVLLTVTRGSVIGGIIIGSEYRYLTDFCLVAVVCGSLALMPPAIVPWWRPDREPDEETLPADVGGIAVPLVATAAVLALIGSSIYSARLFAERWTDNPARTYVANATESMDAIGDDDHVYDGVVPTRVVWRLLYPANLPSNLLGPLGLPGRTFDRGDVADRLWRFDANGVLTGSTVDGVGTRLFESPDCLVEVGPAARRVPLTSDVFDWPWVLQIDYVARRPGELRIEAGDRSITAEVGRGEKGPGGRQSLYAAVDGGYRALTLQTAGTRLCVKTLAIGSPQPNEW